MLCCNDEGDLLFCLVVGEHNERWRETIGWSHHFTEDAWTRFLHHLIICLLSRNCTEILWLTKVKNHVYIVVLSFIMLYRVFPWVLTVLDLSAYHFYKVIIAKYVTGFVKWGLIHTSGLENLKRYNLICE